jgi:hypothetical protein
MVRLFFESCFRFASLSLAAFVLVVAFAFTGEAQTQAACTFTFFQTDFPGSMVLIPEGINDFVTVVGSTTLNTAFIRWSNGGLTFPRGITELVNRNDQGMSAGYDSVHNTIILDRGNLILASVTVGTNVYQTFGIGGINDWGSIVGSLFSHGLKRFFGGGGMTFDFPGNHISSTVANAINDSGTIVGTFDGSIPTNPAVEHGFIHSNGKWAAVDYPLAVSTMLVGISNANVIVGDAFLTPGNEFSTPFLYKDGVFKMISPPNMVGPRVTGISLKQGLIVGHGFPPRGLHPERGFIAKCQ